MKILIQVFEDVLQMLNMMSLVDHQCTHVYTLNLKRSHTYTLEEYKGYYIDP